jgi:hypothetical protein
VKHKSKKKIEKPEVRNERLYKLEVFIISGPIASEFAQQNQVISRTIEMLGEQTLEDLHYSIFNAFDRLDEHMYEFQIGGKGPHDPKAKRYFLRAKFEGSFGDSKPAGDVKKTTLDSLNLKVDQAFGYWFDFGDDWWHQINVLAIENKVPKMKYPQVTERIGESPPQYVDYDEEDDPWDD